MLCHLNRIGALHLPSTPGPSPPEQEVFGWGQLSNEESTGMELFPIQCETLIELGECYFLPPIYNGGLLSLEVVYNVYYSILSFSLTSHVVQNDIYIMFIIYKHGTNCVTNY